MARTSSPSAKAILRSKMRALRRAIPAAERRTAARKAAVKALRVIGARRTIALYLSARDELATGPLVQALLRARREVCVPRLRGDHMDFIAIHRGTGLRRNRFGIAEPIAGRRVSRPDAVILPLLAFDAGGQRLGQGGGHYDRALAPVRALRWPLRIAYGYEQQMVQNVPAGPHDVPVHAVVTDKGVRWVSG